MSDPSQTSSLPSASASPTDSDSDSFFDFSAPVSWIFIPILILALVAASLACLTLRRRRRRRANPAWPGSHPNDPERAGARARGPYPRGGARAGWAPRSSEGLNELGEAPPAYEPKAKPGQAVPGPRDGSIELQQLEHRPDGASSPSAPPPPAAADATPNLPPDYSAVREGAGAASSPPPLITTPPPAVSRH